MPRFGSQAYGSAILPLVLVAQLNVEGLPQPIPTPGCIGCRVDLAEIRRSYSDADWQALMQGKVVTTLSREAGAGGTVQSTNEASAIIPYPPAEVWSVVTDFESRPRFVPGNKEVQIVRRDGNRLWIAEHLRVLLINVRFVVISTLEPEQGRVTWVLDRDAPHDIADTTGSWTVVPLAGGQETLVRYRTWIDSGRSVPRFVEDFLTKRSLPKIVEGIRSEVHRRFPSLRAVPQETNGP
ncbi:MAG TPA: SRPBCC family protein [Candidatus Margulisiibacteriota bacterium]|nr:SRPBCC family protein [Candidatus Margulisiibacteriota bacterium]